MSCTLPSLGRSKSALLPPVAERFSSRPNKLKGRRPEWCGVLDSAPSTRAPSEASSRASSKCSSKCSSVPSSRGSSHPTSPSSSSASHDVPLQCRTGPAAVPMLPLNTMTKQRSLPSLSKEATVAHITGVSGATAQLADQRTMKLHDTEKTRRQFEKACRSNDIELAKICFLRGASLTEPLSSGEFPLFYALRKKHFQFVEFLRQYGVDMNMRDKDGRAALHIAAADNDDEAICRLIELGAKRKLKDRKGQTALHAAAAAGHTKVVELLLNLAAEINTTDKAGWTAVSHAEFNDHFELADRLIQLGGSDPRGMRNETARKGRKS